MKNEPGVYNYRAKVERVIDGDTIDVEIDCGFRISMRQRLRFLDVDTAEIRTKDLAEKALGLLERDFLIEALSDPTAEGFLPLTVHTVRQDSFGRWLSQVWCCGVHINGLMRSFHENHTRRKT